MTGYESKRAAAQDKLAHMTFEQRCRVSEQCLPEAPYRAMLVALHDEMLEALAQPMQEPVAMRMPKVGDRVVCIEDESLATVQWLTAGGSPDIKFDDGSYGIYLLREFAELFRYSSTPQRLWVGLDEEDFSAINQSCFTKLQAATSAESILKEKNT